MPGEVASDKKKAQEEGYKIIFADESAFYLLPFVGKSFAPINSPTMIKSRLTREHLSVISGISADGTLYANVHETSIDGQKAIEFLKHLLKHIPGKIMVIWDGAMIHRCKAIKEFLAECKDGRLHLEKLPAYAPELNPDEGVWQYLKCVSLKNLACQTIKQLGKKLRKCIRQFRARKHLIKACFARVGYI